MSFQILVAYASGTGSTAEVAEAIAEELTIPVEGGQDVVVDVKNVRDVASIDGYDAAVIGSSIRAGRWLPDAVECIYRVRSTLHRIPIAFFTTCLTMVKDNPDSRQIVLGYMEPILALTLDSNLMGLGLFAGSLEPSLRRILPGDTGPYGDYRNWEAIRTWAQAIRPHLLQPLVSAPSKVETLRGVTLSYTNLAQAELSEIDFQEAQIVETDLSQAELRESILSWADLTGSKLVEANLIGASLIGSILNGTDLQDANLSNAILNGAQLQESNLYQARLINADLHWANLTDANLAKADLRGAHFGWANLSGANLVGADLEGAFYNEYTVWPADFSPAEAGCIDLHQLNA